LITTVFDNHEPLLTGDGAVIALQATPGLPVVVPGGAWFLSAAFSHQGPDLLLTGTDGAHVIIRDFFALDNPPDLISEGGAVIAGDLALKLAGPLAPGQVAQATGLVTPGAAESIGKVDVADGTVAVVRIDGTRVAVARGDDIFQGDSIETGQGGAIGITFIDETTFSLGENGRMVIDELVYDRGNQEGVFSANLVLGVFSFVSGQIAKTSPEGMTLMTPVASLGIRGTKVAGRAAQEGEENIITLLPETDAAGNISVGEISVTNQFGTVMLNQIGATVQMTSAFQTPPPPVIFSPQQIEQQYAAALNTLPAPPPDSPGDNPAGRDEAALRSEADGREGLPPREGDVPGDDLPPPDGPLLDGPLQDGPRPEDGGLLLFGDANDPFGGDTLFGGGDPVFNDGGDLSNSDGLLQFVPLPPPPPPPVVVYDTQPPPPPGSEPPPSLTLTGTAGPESLVGGLGDDVLIGGGGADNLTGGGGADRFIYTATTDSGPGAGRDTIADFDAFSPAEDIVLQGLLTGTFNFIGADSNAFGTGNTEARFNDTSKILQIDSDGNGAADMEITLSGVALVDLDNSDFTVT